MSEPPSALKFKAWYISEPTVTYEVHKVFFFANYMRYDFIVESG